MLRFSCNVLLTKTKGSNYKSPVIQLLQYVNRSTVAAAQDLEGTMARPFEEIPGPKPLPIIGNSWRYFPYIGEYHGKTMSEIFTTYYEKYGPIVKVTGQAGQKNTVYLFDPNDIEKVLRNEGKWPTRDFTPSFTYYRTVTRKDLFQGVGGVLATQGEEWQTFRTKVNPALMQPRNTRLYVTQIDEVAREFVTKMRKLKGENEELPANFHNELAKWALESIAVIALDTRLGCLADDIKSDSEQQRMIRAAIDIIQQMYHLDFQASFWKYFSTPAWKKFVKSMDTFNEVAWKYIEQAMARVQKRTVDSEKELSILEKILLRDPDPRTAFVTALDLLFGGIDTTANTVATLLYYLSQNPDKQKILYEELKSVLPSSGNEPLTPDKLESMKYLRACMKESMRLSPVAFGNARTMTQDMVISNYIVPKDTNVFLMHMFLSNMDKYFPHADKFIPERWLKGKNGEPSESKQTHPFVYMPFGFGPRMCLGRRFAELEMQSLTARIIRNFKVEYNYEMKFSQMLILKPSSPLKFKLTEWA